MFNQHYISRKILITLLVAVVIAFAFFFFSFYFFFLLVFIIPYNLYIYAYILYLSSFCYFSLSSYLCSTIFSFTSSSAFYIPSLLLLPSSVLCTVGVLGLHKQTVLANPVLTKQLMSFSSTSLHHKLRRSCPVLLNSFCERISLIFTHHPGTEVIIMHWYYALYIFTSADNGDSLDILHNFVVFSKPSLLIRPYTTSLLL